MKIALDAMGGDLAPRAAIEGAVLAARELGVEVVLVGDRAVVERELKTQKSDGLPITVEHAAEVVMMDESPLESIVSKPDCSINRGFALIHRGGADSFVSAGNSGAMMAAAIMSLGTIPGVDRPAIASLVPSSSGLALLIDAGANTEVKPHNLVQFALMGSVYCRCVREIPHPRVGILSNGEESSKGTDLTRAAAAVLRQMSKDINFVGYVEGRDINRGKVDVVVTDGFTGNVALKTMEGFSSFLLGNLREVFSGSLRGRLGYLLIRKRLTEIRERLDPSEYGGAPLLGVNGVAVIAHGSSNPRAIRNAIRAAANEALVRRVSAEIAELMTRGGMAGTMVKSRGLKKILSRMRDRLHLHKDGEHPDLPRKEDSDNSVNPPEPVRGETQTNEASPPNGMVPEFPAQLANGAHQGPAEQSAEDPRPRPAKSDL